jgi:hypothetical protein
VTSTKQEKLYYRSLMVLLGAGNVIKGSFGTDIQISSYQGRTEMKKFEGKEVVGQVENEIFALLEAANEKVDKIIDNNIYDPVCEVAALSFLYNLIRIGGSDEYIETIAITPSYEDVSKKITKYRRQLNIPDNIFYPLLLNVVSNTLSDIPEGLPN